jgi:hypothetical protein
MDASLWEDHAQRDHKNSTLIGYNGEVHPYRELLEEAKGRFDEELGLEIYQAKHERAQLALEQLCEALDNAHPDVVIVIGDDQDEIFGPTGIPAIGIFTGDVVHDLPRSEQRLASLSTGMRQSAWTSHSAVPYAHKVHATLAKHLVERITEEEFDLTQVKQQVAGRSIGHAFNFVRYRLRLRPEIPFIPVLLNTYMPPNVLSPGRCYRLGQAIARAIHAFDEDLRVAVIGSGGLSHFVVLEDFDRLVLDALKERDRDAISGLSRNYFRSGTSEVLNWITAGGALESLSMDVVDYIPGFRSPAGTGTGMSFALWT